MTETERPPSENRKIRTPITSRTGSSRASSRQSAPASPPRSPVFTPKIGPRRRPRPLDGRLAPLGFDQPKSVEVNILRHGVSVRKASPGSEGHISSSRKARSRGSNSAKKKGDHIRPKDVSVDSENGISNQNDEGAKSSNFQQLLPTLKDWGSEMVHMLDGLVQEDGIQKWKLLAEKGVETFVDDSSLTASHTEESVGNVVISEWGSDEIHAELETPAFDMIVDETFPVRITEVPLNSNADVESLSVHTNLCNGPEKICTDGNILPKLESESSNDTIQIQEHEDSFGLPLNCPPSSVATSPKHFTDASAGEDEVLHYYSGTAGRKRFFEALRAMHSRPAEADQVRSSMNKNGPDSSIDAADSAHRVYIDSLKTISGSLAPPRPTMLHQKHLTILNLTQFGIGDTYGQALAETLAWMPHIKDIRLADNRLTDHSIPNIITALIDLPGVTAVDLSCNKLDSLSSSAVKRLLGDKNCRIEVFKLSGSIFMD